MTVMSLARRARAPASELAPSIQAGPRFRALTGLHLQFCHNQHMECPPVNPKNRTNVKLLSAVLGGSALLAMGSLSLAVHQEQIGPDTTARSSTMTIGSTTTATTPPKVEATSMAVPAIKGPAPLPSEQQAAE
jgi:hypothetical protein